ncbi:hypothetical protein EYF80_065358 [Liparis tanakae]|uniref:Uncharacterized protein n=1 Tax=Liparis tanakae TaxID=230148 RepID=A0A4Z2E6G5_9TELE|nr:hypothetical protein EYF80_065358 [Liparis tanakae]
MCVEVGSATVRRAVSRAPRRERAAPASPRSVINHIVHSGARRLTPSPMSGAAIKSPSTNCRHHELDPGPPYEQLSH